MTPELTYFFKVNLAFILLYGFYRLFFYKDTYFSLRRTVLLMFYVLAFSYPLFNIQEWVKAQEPIAEVIYSYSAMLPEVVVGETESTSWTQIMLKAGFVIYGLVAAALLVRIMIQFASILRIRSKSERAVINGTPVYLLPEPANPFSFFCSIFVYPANHSGKELEEILTHERTHVSQWHSVDVIISELVVAICWINPFVWLLKREIRHNLEYLADHTVIHSGYDSRAYQFHLLGLAHSRSTAGLYNNFNMLDIKNRIIMMNRKRSTKAGVTKYLIFVPLTALLMLYSNIEAVARITNNITADLATNAVPSMVNGTLVDVNGEPLAMASVVIKDTNVGTITDLDGNFALEASGNQTFNFSNIGYMAEEITVTALRANPKVTLKPQDKPQGKGQVFTVVEEMPKYPGGEKALMDFISKSVRYPEQAKKQGVQGRVILSFVVNEDGSTSEHKITRGVSKELDDEALRIVRQFPKWTPGKQKGQAVRVKYTVPIAFRLQGDDAKAETPKEEDKPVMGNHGLAYKIVDNMPVFPGGEAALLQFVSKNMKYPIEAQQKGIQGRVVCSFTVLKDGSITDVEILRGVEQTLDDEAIRVIKSMPKWTPGKLDGKPVNVIYTIPVTFRLS